MGEDTANIRRVDTWGGNEIVDDADIGFRDDLVIVVQQMIIVFMDRAVERVLDRNHRCVATARAKRGEHFIKPLARNNLHPRAKKLNDGFMAKRSGLALKSYAKLRLRFEVFSQW